MSEELPPGLPTSHMWDAPVLRHHRGPHRYLAASSFMMGPPPYYSDLLNLADILIREGRYELAVIVAQMACEVVVEQTLTPLLKGKKSPQNFNVHNGAVLKLYKKLAPDPIDTQPFWAAFGRHAIRRHNVVHRAGRVDPSDARDSTTAARQLVEHVHEVRRTIL